MSSDPIAADLTRNTENSATELLTRSFFFFCAVLSIVTTVGIVVLLVSEAAKFFDVTASLMGVAGTGASIGEFLTGTTWNIHNKQFGVLTLASATVMVTLVAAIIALPLGVATAIYLSEYARPRFRSVLKPALEILAGVPTVVYGIFAFIYITPVLGIVFPAIGTFNVLSAGIVVGIMIIPMVASISEDAMSAVPDELRQAGYGMGATKFDVSVGIVVPAALSGIVSSFILALSRAIGETMAVAIAAGAQAKFHIPVDPGAYLDKGMPMTSAMVHMMTSDIAGGGLAYRSIFAIGLTLFCMTLTMNVVSDIIAQRFKEEY